MIHELISITSKERITTNIILWVLYALINEKVHGSVSFTFAYAHSVTVLQIQKSMKSMKSTSSSHRNSIETELGHPGHPGHVLSGSSGSDPL